MSIIRAYSDEFHMVDQTPALEQSPNQYGLLTREGIFENQFLFTDTVTFDLYESTFGLVPEKPYGERTTFSGNDKRQIFSSFVPHHPLDDNVTVADVRGIRATGTQGLEQVSAVVARKMNSLDKSYKITREVAIAKALRGIKYDTTGALGSSTWYDEFAIAGGQTTVDFDLGNAATDPRTKVQEVVALIQDRYRQGGEILEEITFYCHPTFFNNLVGNAFVIGAYENYSSDQEPLRDSLRQGMQRVFRWQDVTFVEYRGTEPDGTPLIPAGQAIAVPRGTSNLFVTYFAPAAILDTQGEQAKESYAVTMVPENGREISIETESNFVVLPKRPDLFILCDDGIA